MLPDEMEAEKNRKMILAQADEIDILKNNIKELQEQLNVAHKRIASVSEDWGDMRDKLDAAQIHNKNLTQSLANAYADISRLAEEANANQ